MLSCEFYEIFKNIFSTERIRATASDNVFIILSLDVTDDDISRYEESQDPQPFPFRRFVPRIRIRVRKIKCRAICTAYYACMAKTKGLGWLACKHIKKRCRC